MTVSTALEAIDRSLRAAVAERDKCLAAWRHSPNADNAKALHTAKRELDAKLEQRFAAQ